jgi:tyrosine-protein kinase Etk/Wzc
MTEISDIHNKKNEQSNSMLIAEYIKILVSYKKYILISTLVVGLVTFVLVYFVIKPVFYSSGTVKTTAKSNTGMSGMLSSSGNIPDIGGLSDLTSGGSVLKELSLYENIILSRRCLEETIIKFKLMEDWDFKYMQDALKHFRDNVIEIKKDKNAGTLDVGIFDDNPQRVKEIVEFLLYQLNKINIEMNVQNAKSNKDFIESRYNLTLNELKKAEDSLKQFQILYGMAPDIQVKSSMQALIQLEADLSSEQVKLELLKRILSSDQPEVIQEEAKINALNKRYEEIKNSTDLNTYLRTKDAPDIVLNYYRLARNVEIQNKILSTLLPIFEQSKIEERRETPSVIVLDSPYVPDHKVKPKRLTLIAISLLLTFIISSIASIFYQTFYKKFKENYQNIIN